MSIGELKVQAAQLSNDEKVELARFLHELMDPLRAARQTRVKEAMDEMDAGKKFARADFERLDKDLVATGL